MEKGSELCMGGRCACCISVLCAVAYPRAQECSYRQFGVETGLRSILPRAGAGVSWTVWTERGRPTVYPLARGSVVPVLGR